MSYYEMIEEHIRQIVRERQIQEVLHFTRLERLGGILEYGILGKSDLLDRGFEVFDRMDKSEDSVSVSISCYYPDMFWAKRNGAQNQPWIILTLHPSLLWQYHCLFFRRGVPTSESQNQSGKRFGGFALEALFDDASFSLDPDEPSFRDKHSLPPSWPTFSDAEVQVKSPIAPNYIKAAVVENPDLVDTVREIFRAAGREECEVVVQPFDPRIDGKPFRWG
ncbi:MAG: DarT ssDNA thymidine ADP-ribosyltransferase family protein [Novosphingobium sp.]